MTCRIERWGVTAMVLLLSLSVLPAHAARSVATQSAVGEALDLEDLFFEASEAFGVPVEILMALGYTESHWKMRDGAPSIDFAYGIMGLRERDDIDTLGFAAKLLDLPRERLKREPRANIFGAAAVLEALARNYYQFEVESVRELPLEAWEPVLRQYSGMPDATTYVLQLYTPIHRGIDTMNDAGQRIHFGPVKIDLASFEDIEPQDKVFSQDYPPAAWDPAASCNYTWSERPASYPIEMVVIHVTEGSYAGTISWFKNCSAGASAHYVIRSSDGAVTQMVGNNAIAWHAGNWDYNTRSIGIEHEGFISECSWFTDAMYRSSADLTAFIADTYGFPKDRAHIIGHNEVPGCPNGGGGGASCHTDPGPCWDWTRYMELVRGSGDPDPDPGDENEIIVNNLDAGFVTRGDWKTGNYAGGWEGDYRWTETAEGGSAVATWTPGLAKPGDYDIYVWYNTGSNRSTRAKYTIYGRNGAESFFVNQQQSGSRWLKIATTALLPGVSRVELSNDAPSGYVVIADAVKFVYLGASDPGEDPVPTCAATGGKGMALPFGLMLLIPALWRAMLGLTRPVPQRCASRGH